MAKTLTPPEALHRAAALCSSSEHCIADIREKLSRWGIGEPDARTIVERLVQERFIDEGRYAIAFAKDKFRFSGWGRIKIRYALQQKRIGNSDIVNALSLIDEEAYTTRLADLLEKIGSAIPPLPDEPLSGDAMKHLYPFCGELYLGHLRYGTFGRSGLEACHPFVRENACLDRTLLLAGNFNLTDTAEIFRILQATGHHPASRQDGALILQLIGHYLEQMLSLIHI